jgi:protein-S-isoprenylcysteine O-methyltransferase Ste14
MLETDMTPLTALGFVWLAWLVSWIAAAGWASASVARPKRRLELRYSVVQLLGLLLYALALPRQNAALHLPILWCTPTALGFVLVALAAAGLVFTLWARLHLGRLWSASVTRKAAHKIIDTGPYGLVRHPIYTGVLAAMLATTAIMGTVTAMPGFLLLLLGFVMKARLEEDFLRKEMGANAYDAYARRVPMLVPFMPSHRL